jgi:hypothetical protein
MGWSDENAALAARLWTEGKSAVDIGKILGVTRKAVIGKMHRMGAEHGKPAALAKVAPPRIVRRPNERKAHDEKRVNIIKFPVKEVRVVGEPLMRPWTERKFGECAFPIVDGDVTYSCCADTKGHRSYCPKHQRVMYTNTAPFSPSKPPRLKTDGRHII